MEVTDFCDGAVQSGRAGQVRAHGVGGLRDRPRCSCSASRAWYLLKGRARRHSPSARWRSPPASASPRRCRSSCSATRAATPPAEHQKMKLAAIEGDVGDRAGAGRLHRRSAFPTRRRARRTTPIHIPWVLGLIATRSLTSEVPGINELVRSAPRSASAAASWPTTRCRRSAPRPRTDAGGAQARVREAHGAISATRCCSSATSTIRARRRPTQISKAAWDTVPHGARRCSGRSASWSASACYFIVADRPRSSGSSTVRQLDALPLAAAGGRLLASRCHGLPPSSAGSSPSTAASRGRSRACCRRASAVSRPRRRQRRADHLSASSLFYTALFVDRDVPDAQDIRLGPGSLARATPAHERRARHAASAPAE